MMQPDGTTRRRNRGILIAVLGAAFWSVSFIVTLYAFSGMSADGAVPATVLGVPWSAAGLVVGAAVTGVGVLMASRGRPGTVPRRVLAGALTLAAGVIGIVAAWVLTADKVITLTEPQAALECNFSLLVQCGANLASWQGAVFGFPNPLLGLSGWAAVVVVGVAMASGIRISRRVWAIFTVGVGGAMVFVIWLIAQSIFSLGTLCPWCMVTWTVTIPMFWFSAAELASRASSGRIAAAGERAIGWLPLITLLSYLAVAIIAQLRLDVIAYL
jgi:uncharacterized membrane protein